jgi:putative cell wall-binding protein
MKRLLSAVSAGLLVLSGSFGAAVLTGAVTATAAHATDITPTDGILYVNGATGNDGNDCLTAAADDPESYNGPCKTIANALSLIGQTDDSFGEGAETVDYTTVSEISVAAGTYVEDQLAPDFTTPGTGDPLTIEGPSGDTPTVTVEPSDPSESVFDIGDGDATEVTLEDLAIEPNPNPVETVLPAIATPDVGGGIDNEADGSDETPGLTLDDDTISGFSVVRQGGGVFADETTFTRIEATTISGNTAGEGGGGVYNDGVLQVEDASTVSGNTASEDGGGGILNDNEGSTEVVDSAIGPDNQAAGDESANGGGIASYDDGVEDGARPRGVTPANAVTPFLAVEESTVDGNTAEGGGGGIHSDGGILDVGLIPMVTLPGDEQPNGPVEERTTISGNTATTGDGGGVWAGSEANDETITIDDSTVDGNSATAGNGGGIWTQATSDDAAVDIEGDTISGNTAPSTADGEGEGGGVWVSDANDDTPETVAQLDNDVIGAGGTPALPTCPGTASISANAPNSAQKGGGVYNAEVGESQGDATLESTTVDGNCAGAGGGGGVYTGFDNLGIFQTTVADNIASAGDGGGVLSDDDDEVQINDSTVAGNEALGGNGGGIANEGDSETDLGYATVVDNSATGSGGGLFIGGEEEEVTPAVDAGGTDNCNLQVRDDDGANLENDDVGDVGAPECFGATDLDFPDQIGVEPDLGTLQVNPGAEDDVTYPPTAIPGDDSPALNNGGTDCRSEFAPDELGQTQNEDGACTIGAVQVLNNNDGSSDVTRVTPADDGDDFDDVEGTIIADNSISAPPSGGGGGVTPPPTPPPPPVTNVSGPNRVGTAVAASQTEFPNGGAGAVVLARSDLFPDALTGVPLAVAKDAPLLLTEPTELDPATATEIQRVLAKGGIVYLLGGTDALSAGVEAAVQALGYQTTRIGGIDRYATAIDIAQALGSPKVVFEADGTNFPDALSAGSAAVQQKGCILLTLGSSQDPETAAYLAALDPTTEYALGGPAASADPTATPIVGADRYGTSAMVAAQFFPDATGLGAATGLDFPDALTGGTLEAASGNPLILVDPSYTSVSALPSVLATYLHSLETTLKGIVVFGGPAALPAAVTTALQDAVD